MNRSKRDVKQVHAYLYSVYLESLNFEQVFEGFIKYFVAFNLTLGDVKMELMFRTDNIYSSEEIQSIYNKIVFAINLIYDTKIEIVEVKNVK